MFFTSISYWAFVGAVLVVLRVSPKSTRWLVLLASSIAFYAALTPPYLLAALGLVAVSTYLCARGLSEPSSGAHRRTFFWLGIVVNLAVLISFRSPGFNLASLGVSFYVFTAISYLIDVYVGVQPPEGHFGYVALHLAFFPKLVQGPIERAGDLLPQLRAAPRGDYDGLRAGLLLIAGGLFKKLVVADHLAAYVNPIYGDIHSHAGLVFVIVTYAYALQLYFDFSGYTDLALGTARLFGLNLTNNFNSPYLATSVPEFWRRWHISFSRWILDYLFTPLQMRWRRWKTHGTAAALVLTFIIGGWWHGVSWHFVVWGLLHGTYLATSMYYGAFKRAVYGQRRRGRPSLWLSLWQRVLTFNLVCFAWIFFRANSVPDGFYVVTHLFSGIHGSRWLIALRGYRELSITLTALTVMGGVALMKRRTDVRSWLLGQPVWIRWPVYYAMILGVLLFGVFGHSEFMYAGF